MDEAVRDLERRARGGDAAAVDGLAAARARVGALPAVARGLTDDAFPRLPAEWVAALGEAGERALAAGALELACRVAPSLEEHLPPKASLGGLLEVMSTAARARDPAAAGSIKKALGAARLGRVEDLRMTSQVVVVEESARCVEAVARGEPVTARRHLERAAERAAQALGADAAREAARTAGLAAFVLGPSMPVDEDEPVTAGSLRGRLRDGTLRLADLGLAAFGGDAAAEGALPSELQPYAPKPLESWLRWLMAWGSPAYARALVAIARRLELPPSLDAAASLAEEDGPPRAEVDAWLTRLEGEAAAPARLVREALRARTGSIEPPWRGVMDAVRAGGVKQEELRAVAGKALAAWALGPGTRFPGVAPPWTTAADQRRQRSNAYISEVIDDGRTDGLVERRATSAQVKKLRALVRAAALTDDRVEDLVAMAGADRLEHLRRDFASWLIDFLQELSGAAPPRASARPSARSGGVAVAVAERRATKQQLALVRQLMELVGADAGIEGVSLEPGALTFAEADGWIERLRERLGS